MRSDRAPESLSAAPLPAAVDSPVIIMLSAERHIHIVAADLNLLSRTDKFSIHDTGDHIRLSSAPADRLNLLDFIRIHQQISRTFKQLVAKIVFQSVAHHRTFAAVYDLYQFLHMMLFSELRLIDEIQAISFSRLASI